MRVMAHPLRMRILGSLRLDGPATSAILARRLDTDSGQTSHHLRLLARHGFVTEAPERGRGSHGRERWWKAAHASTTWDTGDAEATRAFERTARAVWDLAMDKFHREASHGRWSPQWYDAAASSERVIRTTAEGLERLREQIDRLIEEADNPGPDSETVIVVTHAYPRRAQK
ncbi:helix-turn-helix transcriptional regulator [Actinoplanes sp. LDG1-06]|uniref:Helix-turn-helix transcriptional regulator n=2 Tax=Paractinoplanes ovalisporus TaxID=2810368 RepID=A0ABS2AJ81_9ACTN|nr:helix-turn-helix transcriptional regulator [Actinoplanes ovalisporus]